MNKNIINDIALVAEWSIILSLIFLNLNYHHYLLMLFSILIIGTRIHALGILMHEASHFNLLSNPMWNDLITKIFITSPVFISLDSYRKTHQFSLTDKDPTHTRKEDIAIYHFPKKNSFEFIIQLLQILGGYGIYLSIHDLIRNKKNEKKKNVFLIRVFKLFGFLLFVALLIRFQLVNSYLIFWVLPCLSVLPLLNYWRTISEHANLHSQEPTRTVIYSPIIKWLLTPYNINHHLEHHLFPKKSWYKLTKLKEEEHDKLQSGKVTIGFKNLWNEFIL